MKKEIERIINPPDMNGIFSEGKIEADNRPTHQRQNRPILKLHRPKMRRLEEKLAHSTDLFF